MASIGVLLFFVAVIAFFVGIVLLLLSIFFEKLLRPGLYTLLGAALSLLASFTLCSTSNFQL